MMNNTEDFGETKPSPTAFNGRTPGGRFSAGNTAASGNPHARRVGQLRSAFLVAVTEADIEAIVASLLVAAKCGDIAAARLLLDRALGKIAAADAVSFDADGGAATADGQATGDFEQWRARLLSEIAELRSNCG